MSLLTRYLDDAYVAWLSSAMGCCTARPRHPDRGSIRGTIDQYGGQHLQGNFISDSQFAVNEHQTRAIHYYQPQPVPPLAVPFPEPPSRSHSRSHTRRSSSQEWLTRTRSFASRASTRGSYSLKRKLNMYNGIGSGSGSGSGPRRPHISGPSDFRHVQSSPSPPRRRSFRPLQLSIYLPENQLSPILAHFDDSPALPPATAHTHTRSASAMSNFSIPRKAVASYQQDQRPSYDAYLASAHSTPESVAESFTHALTPRPSLPGSLSTQQLLAALDDPLAYPAPARLRANTLPVLSEQVERVKSVLMEREALERRIRDVDELIVERRSMSLKSRSGSIYTSVDGELSFPPCNTP